MVRGGYGWLGVVRGCFPFPPTRTRGSNPQITNHNHQLGSLLVSFWFWLRTSKHGVRLMQQPAAAKEVRAEELLPVVSLSHDVEQAPVPVELSTENGIDRPSESSLLHQQAKKATKLARQFRTLVPRSPLSRIFSTRKRASTLAATACDERGADPRSRKCRRCARLRTVFFRQLTRLRDSATKKVQV